MMTRTEEMLTLMEVGIGVREAVFVTTGILPLDVAQPDRADYERGIETVLSFGPPAPSDRHGPLDRGLAVDRVTRAQSCARPSQQLAERKK
jgi:hypothetical protein